MFRNRLPTTSILLTMLPLIATSSCSDERVTQVAREAADRQAQQNTEMAQVNKEVAAGSHQLVEADAKARQEIIGVHRDLQAERARLETGWSKLEEERHDISNERRMESMLMAVGKATGCLFLVVAVLGFCWYALVNARGTDATDAQLSELLIAEIFPDQPSLLADSDNTLLGQSQLDQRE